MIILDTNVLSALMSVKPPALHEIGGVTGLHGGLL